MTKFPKANNLASSQGYESGSVGFQVAALCCFHDPHENLRFARQVRLIRRVGYWSVYLINSIRESGSSQCEQAHLCVGRLRKEGEKVEDDWEGGKRNKRVGDAFLLSLRFQWVYPKATLKTLDGVPPRFFQLLIWSAISFSLHSLVLSLLSKNGKRPGCNHWVMDAGGRLRLLIRTKEA